MHREYLVLIFILAGVIYSRKARKLTLPGSLTGAGLAVLLFLGTDITGFVLMTAFFLLGTAATGWQRQMRKNVTEGEQRTAMQVLANAGAAGILAGMVLAFPQYRYHCVLMLAAAFSSATADTLSSELGTVYGRRFYDVLTLRPGLRGRNGVISLEGTLWGLAGSVVLAVIYGLFESWGPEVLWIVLAGTAGNLSDSVLGAWLENKGVIGNNAVNFLNTVTAALTVLALAYSW